MTILQDLQIKIDFILNDQQLKSLESALHNVKSEALGLGYTHDSINKSLRQTANLYAVAILENEKKINSDRKLSESELAHAESLKHKNKELYNDIKAKIEQTKQSEKVFQVNQKFIESYDRYKDLLKKGANFGSYSEYKKQEEEAINHIQKQNNKLLLKEILLNKTLGNQFEKTAGKIKHSAQSIESSFNNSNNSINRFNNNIKSGSGNINSFSDNLRIFTSQLMFVNPATMSFAFALQGFGQMFKSLADIAQNSTDVVRKSVASLQQIIFGLGVGIASASGAVTYLSLSTSKYADDIKKNSEIVGMTATEYQKLSYAAKIAGMNQQEMASSLNGLFQALKSGKDGKLTEVQEKFLNLGIALKRANGESRNVSEILSDVADKLSKIESPIKKATIANELFGDSGRKLLPFLAEGSEKLRELGIEAENSGNVLSEDNVKKLSLLQTSYRRLSSMLNGLKLSIGMSLLPFMQSIILRLTEWYEANGMIIRQNMESFFKNITFCLEKFSQIIKDAYIVIKKLTKSLQDMGISLDLIVKILLFFASWKLFGIIGNIFLGKSKGKGIFSTLFKSISKFRKSIITLFRSMLKYGLLLIRVFGRQGLAGAFRLLGRLLLGLLTGISASAVAIGAAVIGVFLLIDDFITWTEGGDSFFGRIFGDWKTAKTKIDEFLKEIEESFKNMWTKIKNFFYEKLIDPILQYGLVGLLEAIINICIFIGELIADCIKFLIVLIFDIIMLFVNFLATEIPYYIDICIEKIKAALKAAKPYITDFFDWLILSTSDGFKKVGSDIFKLFKAIISDLKLLFSDFFSFLKNCAIGIWGSLNNFFGLNDLKGINNSKKHIQRAIMQENGKFVITDENGNKKSFEFEDEIDKNLNTNLRLFNIPESPIITPNNNKNLSYNINSPLNVNINTQSDPKEISNIIQQNLNEHWEYQMRMAKNNIFNS